MTCEPCISAQTDPAVYWFTNGCTSCVGRALAVMRFRRDELSPEHSPEVVEAFEEWVPIVRRASASVS